MLPSGSRLFYKVHKPISTMQGQKERLKMYYYYDDDDDYYAIAACIKFKCYDAARF